MHSHPRARESQVLATYAACLFESVPRRRKDLAHCLFATALLQPTKYTSAADLRRSVEDIADGLLQQVIKSTPENVQKSAALTQRMHFVNARIIHFEMQGESTCSGIQTITSTLQLSTMSKVIMTNVHNWRLTIA